MENQENPVLQPDVEASHTGAIEPVVKVEEAPKPVEHKGEDISKKRSEKKVRTRKVYKRNVFLSILFSIVASPAYFWFWTFEIDKETKAVCKTRRGPSPSLVLLFTIITFGIYSFYWVYQVGKRQSDFYISHGINKNKLKIVYLAVLLVGWGLAIIAALLIALTGTVEPGSALAIFAVCFSFVGIFSIVICTYIVYGMMQYHLNKMIVLVGEEIYCKDSSIFNRPFWSIIFLYVVASSVPQYIGDFVERAFNGIPPMPQGADVVQMVIKKSADQVINACNPDQICTNVATIIGAVLVLWWFALMFRHTKYPGVLNIKNFGKALLLCLPAFAVAAMNGFGLLVDDNPTINYGLVILGFVPGFTEEVMFRGMIVPNLVRIYNSSKGIWIALFVSAGLFGSVHAGNILAGADVGTSIFQVCYAFALGIIFAAVLLRTGNLWASIICHGTIDALAMMESAAQTTGAVQTQGFALDIGTIVLIAMSVIFIAYGIWLCRPKKHKEILGVWRDKFGDAMLEPKN